MKTAVAIIDQAIVFPPQRAEAAAPGCGAGVDFFGVVRGEESGEAIRALEYEAYQPMAQREIERLLHELAQLFRCEEASVTHRIGVIPVGETAIHVHVSSRHRAEGFGLLAAFMDCLKQDVPIWKVKAHL